MVSNPEIIFLNIHSFLFLAQEMAGNEVDKEVLIMAVSRGQIGHHTISGNISLFQIHQKLKTVLQRLQPANFVTKCSVVAVLPGQQLMILLNCCMKEN